MVFEWNGNLSLTRGATCDVPVENLRPKLSKPNTFCTRFSYDQNRLAKLVRSKLRCEREIASKMCSFCSIFSVISLQTLRELRPMWGGCLLETDFSGNASVTTFHINNLKLSSTNIPYFPTVVKQVLAAYIRFQILSLLNSNIKGFI